MSPYLDIRGTSTNVDTRKCWRASTRCSCAAAPPMRPDARRPPPVASGMAASMSPDLRERRPGQWRWRESNLAGGVGTSWLVRLTCGNAVDIFGPVGSDWPDVLTASTRGRPATGRGLDELGHEGDLVASGLEAACSADQSESPVDLVDEPSMCVEGGA